MRIVISALFLGTSIAAMCQSKVPAFKAADNAGETLQCTKAPTICNRTSPDFSTLRFLTLEGELRYRVPATWHWKNGQVDSNNVFRSLPADADGQISSKTISLSTPSGSALQPSTLVAQNVQPSFHEMLPQESIAKVALIPIQWPDAKLEPVPTQWPNLKLFPITSQRSTPPPERVP
jgi:hypothetical protein